MTMTYESDWWDSLHKWKSGSGAAYWVKEGVVGSDTELTESERWILYIVVEEALKEYHMMRPLPDVDKFVTYYLNQYGFENVRYRKF